MQKGKKMLWSHVSTLWAREMAQQFWRPLSAGTWLDPQRCLVPPSLLGAGAPLDVA